MKIRTVFIVLGFTVFVKSCIPSLYPLYRSRDLLTDDNLDGFYETGEDEYWKIRFLEGNRLRIGEQDIPLGYSYRDHLLQYLQ